MKEEFSVEGRYERCAEGEDGNGHLNEFNDLNFHRFLCRCKAGKRILLNFQASTPQVLKFKNSKTDDRISIQILR